MELRLGWLVPPLSGETAASTMSTPASAALRTVLALIPLVSWVWRWIGMSILLAQLPDQHLRGVGARQPGHVLDAQDVRAHVAQLACHRDVVVEVVLRARGVQQVAGVADGGFADRVRLEHGLHRDDHVVDAVEGVEDAEDVDALARGLQHELPHDVVRIAGVAHGVGGAQQHLEADVRDARAQLTQALPGVLVQEAHRGVEGGAAPHLEAEEVGQALGDRLRGLEQVVCAHARRQQRLMGVAHGGVGDQQALLRSRPGGEAGRAQLLQPLPAAGRGGSPSV